MPAIQGSQPDGGGGGGGLDPGDQAKLDGIAVTQAVDLDQMEADIAALNSSLVLRGVWDANSGVFPGGGTAQAGAVYIVSVAGTINAVTFAVGDRIVAIVDNASTGTFVGNWFKEDYTDAVLSVVGQTGAVTIAQILTALLTVDGSGSGLDADLLDGLSSTAFQAASTDLTDLVARWVAASASGPASLALAEDTDNGTSVVTLTAPAALAADRIITLPDVAGVLALLSQVVQPTGGGLETVQTHGSTGATETIDVANGNVHVVTQDQACVYTFTNPASSTTGCSFTLIMTAVTGAATWPASVNWPDATAPTLSGRCILTFVTVDGGTTWDGFLAGAGMA